MKCDCCGCEDMQNCGYNQSCSECGAVFNGITGKRITLEQAEDD